MGDCKYLDGELDVEPSDDGMSEIVHGTFPVCMFTDGDMDECPYPERECPAKASNLNITVEEKPPTQEGV